MPVDARRFQRRPMRALVRSALSLQALARPAIALPALALPALAMSATALAQAPADADRARPSAVAAVDRDLMVGAQAGGSFVLPFQPGVRLSEALFASSVPEGFGDVYEPATVWSSDSETKAQTALRDGLLRDIEKAFGKASPLHLLIRNAPVTGRVLLPKPFAEEMAVDPKSDPILRTGQSVQVYRRPSHVLVMNRRGAICRMPYAAGRESSDYFMACMPTAAGRDARVHLVQPDGQISRFEVGAWRRSDQPVPMPGAWIYVDDADEPSVRLPSDFTQRLLTWLSFQGVGLASGSAEALRKTGAVLLPALPMPPLQALAGSPWGYESRSLPVTSNDLGMTGLMQTPSARMRPAGNFTYTQTRVLPYDRYNVIFQPFDWLQGGFRYNDPRKSLGANNENVQLDKNIDVKVRLLQESRWLPELAVGFQDVGGTGRFGGEYVVGNKRHGDFDFSLGLGWGYLGRRGDLSNPLGVLKPGFNNRPPALQPGDPGGTFSIQSFFRGRTQPFGGVQYHTPWDPLILKLEYDPNDYSQEIGTIRRPPSSPLNVGAVYRYNRYVDFMLGLERGNQVQFGIALNVDLLGPQMPKIRDDAMPAVKKQPPQSLAETSSTDWARVAGRIENQTQWRVGRISQQQSDVRIDLSEQSGFYYGPKLERAAAVLNEALPPDAETFTLVYSNRGSPLSASVIDREAFVRSQTELVPPGEQRTVVSSVDAASVPQPEEPVFQQSPKRFNVGLSPYYSQTLGGVKGLLFYQAGAVADMKLNLAERTWLNSALRLRMLDNYDGYEESPSPSTLPRTRTFLKEYNTTSRFNIPVLQANHMERVSENGFAMVYGGLLEYAFGGVGAEYLYQPRESRVAVGVDVNSVKLRDFDQKFSFRDYSVNTGHVTVYWDTGIQDILLTTKVGQYLGGDRGVTLTAQRVFNNGVTMGAYATKTNVSSKDFGEGSFDKGIFVQVPFDYLLPKSTDGVVNFRWSPLTRDGGAVLFRSQQLYNLNDVRGRRALYVQPPAP